MSADCFYEGQGRLDGAICDYNEDDKMAFLARLHAIGCRNIEMEAAQFAAFTHRLGIKGTGLCTTLLDRPVEGIMHTRTPSQICARPLAVSSIPFKGKRGQAPTTTSPVSRLSHTQSLAS